MRAFLFGIGLFISIILQANTLKSVVQPLSSQDQTYSFTAPFSGDYEIGEAWIAVAQGDTAIVNIYKGSQMVQTKKAPSGEVTRFHKRIEGVKANENLNVEVLSNGSSYILEYKIASATPYHNGLATINVDDYGAKGDGVTNDKPAIDLALSVAKQSGGTVQFNPEKKYRITGGDSFLFDLQKTNDIAISGIENGDASRKATLILATPRKLINLYQAQNISIGGFNIDYKDLSYAQGEILNANTTDWTVDIKIFDRYPVPEVGEGDWVFSRIFIPEYEGARSGTGQHLYVTKVLEMPDHNDGRHLRVYADIDEGGSKTKDAIKACASGEASEFILRTKTGTTDISYTTVIKESSCVLLHDIQFFRIPKQGITPSNNTGPITIRNVNFRIPDQSQDSVYHRDNELLVSWRGHYLTRNNRFSVLFDGGLHDGGAMYDDLYNGHLHLALVQNVNGNSLQCEINKLTDNWEVGDWIGVWNHEQSKKFGMARILSVSYPNTSTVNVTLDTPISGIVANETTLVNEELMNHGSVIRNWRTTTLGAAEGSMRLRTPVWIYDCHFENIFIYPSCELDREGPRTTGVLIEDCYISTDMGKEYPVAITNINDIAFRNCIIDNGAVIVKKNSEKVCFDHISWTNFDDDFYLNVEDYSTVYVFNHCAVNGNEEGLELLHQKSADSEIIYANPPGYVSEIKSNKAENSNKLSRIYPNPVSDDVTIMVDDQSINNVAFYSLSGALIAQYSGNKKNTYPTENLDSGIYILKFRTREQLFSQLIIKE